MVEKIDPGAGPEVPGANFLELVRWGQGRGSCPGGQECVEGKEEIL